jgi:hypothetical protein
LIPGVIEPLIQLSNEPSVIPVVLPETGSRAGMDEYTSFKAFIILPGQDNGPGQKTKTK